MFGLINRNCSNFNCPKNLKYFYTHLIRSQLEYASIIWETNAIGHTAQIAIVQNNVLRYICFKFRLPHSTYNGVLKCLNLKSF